MNEEKTALVIEDDREIAQVVSVNLADAGLRAEIVPDGRAGLAKALSGNFAIVILDLMLPQMDGIEVCRKIREKNKLMPILMLTAKTEEIDRVLGLEIGADDYMTKPFSVRELIARVRALLRRAEAGKETAAEKKGKIELAGFTLDFEKRRAAYDGKAFDLTVKEFELLALFIANPGRTYTRSELLRLVWGYQYEGYEHTVNSHINRLRAKIEEDPGNPRFLITMWGVGYRFTEPEEL